jgi:hypothetical protein
MTFLLDAGEERSQFLIVEQVYSRSTSHRPTAKEVFESKLNCRSGQCGKIGRNGWKEACARLLAAMTNEVKMKENQAEREAKLDRSIWT